jgi:hypothetical protein
MLPERGVPNPAHHVEDGLLPPKQTVRDGSMPALNAPCA